MNQRTITMGLMVVVCLMFGVMVVFDLNKKKDQDNPVRTENLLGDNWGTPVVSDTPDRPDPIVDDKNRSQITASNYQDAIRRSGQEGMPVLVFFEADWCNWCTRMKNESMTDKDIKDIMKNYVLVFVDYDRSKSVARKFGIGGLPSYVITNMNETKLKSGAGYLDADRFHDWLNNSSMYRQPKQQEEDRNITPPPPEDRQPDRRPRQPDRRRQHDDFDDDDDDDFFSRRG